MSEILNNPAAGLSLAAGRAAVPTVAELRYRQRALLAHRARLDFREVGEAMPVMLDGPAVTVPVPGDLLAAAVAAELGRVEAALVEAGEKV